MKIFTGWYIYTESHLLFTGRNFIRHYSTQRITTHYSVVPRDTDPRWEGEYLMFKIVQCNWKSVYLEMTASMLALNAMLHQFMINMPLSAAVGSNII